MNTQQRNLIAAISLCAAAIVPNIANAKGPSGHIPLTNPGSGPSGRTLPAMPTPTYGAPLSIATTPSVPPRPVGLPAAGVTGTPAMTVGRPNYKATSRFPR
jgi:hypothetical protein